MINSDEGALICDFAETYHIYNYREFEPFYVATLANGLRENSRIKMALADTKVDLYSTLLAAIADRVSVLIWQNTKDGQSGTNMPVSILECFNNKPKHENHGFESGDDFMSAWKAAMNG